MSGSNHFLGRDGFIWFYGVVEDRNDPAKLGRVRVRCIGYHTDELVDIPTEDLPWATVVNPTTSSGVNGLGSSTFLLPGSWVFGFFKDPDILQRPVILVTLSGKPADYVTKGGFKDKTANADYGPYPVRFDESDVNRLSHADTVHPNPASRDAGATTNVTTAVGASWNEPKTTDINLRGNDASGTNPETKTARQTKARVSSEYPYNKVFESESGHIKEYDDTPFAERIHEYHKSGTFYEIDADGDKVTRIVGDNYEVIAGDNYVNVKGSVNLTIDSDCNTYIKGNWDIKVDGNKTETIKGTVSETYQSSKTEKVTGSVSETYSSSQNTAVQGSRRVISYSDIDMDAPVITLN